MKFEEYYRFMEYILHSIFVFLFFVVITVFVSLVVLYVEYFITLSKKQTGQEPFRYADFVKSQFTKRRRFFVLVLIPLCFAGGTLALISIRAYYRANIPIFELRNTSMLRIRTGGLCHRVPEVERELYKTKDKDEIKEFLDKISIDPWNKDMGTICGCCGHMTFEFYDDNDKLISACSFHHNSHLRFPDLMGDLYLTPRSRGLLITWLDERIGRNKNSAIKA